MATFAWICGALVVLPVSVVVLESSGLPAHMAIGLTFFGACLFGLLALAIRIALLDRARHGDHEH